MGILVVVHRGIAPNGSALYLGCNCLRFKVLIAKDWFASDHLSIPYGIPEVMS